VGCDIPDKQLWSWIDRDAPELAEHLAICPVCGPRAERIRKEIQFVTASSTTHIPLPETIGSYRIERLIGEGGQALVFEAEQSSPRRLVALKVLKGGCLAGEKSIKHFKRETQTLAKLQHPAIATIHEAGRTEEGLHYFAMELVVGQPLHTYVHDRKPNRRDLLALLQKICEAVEYAHRHGVIHRDLKPSNILVNEGGEPKILDFGLARMTNADVVFTLTATATTTGRVEGTPRYMSPEQARGQLDEIDTRSDVYSLDGDYPVRAVDRAAAPRHQDHRCRGAPDHL